MNQRRIIFLNYLFILAVFAMDMITPVGLSVWLLYFFPVTVMAWNIPVRNRVYFFTLLCSVLVISGSFSLWPFISEMEVAIINRLIFIAALWIMMLAVRSKRVAEMEIVNKTIQLKKLDSELIQAEHKERQHFAAVLHDTVAQTLAAVKLRFSALQNDIADDGKQIFLETQDLIAESIRQTRSIMAEMTPQILTRGLVSAIEWQAEQIEGKYNFPILFRDKGSDPGGLPYDLKIILYEATRELALNSIKHSGAKGASIDVSGGGQAFTIRVKDDGAGFDEHKAIDRELSSGFGLTSIRERLRPFDWQVRIITGPGRGTEVILEQAGKRDADRP